MLQKILLSILFLSFFSNTQAQDWVKKMNDPGVNFYEVQSSFNKYWRKEERKEKLKSFLSKSKPTEEENEGLMVYKRWESFAEPRLYPTGNRDLLLQGNKEIEKLISNPAYRSSMLAGGNWHPIGASVVPSDGGGAGRVNCVRFHPTNSSKIYVGAPAGGLWMSNDGGLTWSTNTDHLPSIGVNDIAINPINTNEMYIATGDDDGGDTYSVGVLKSVDAGNTWQMTGLSFTTNQLRKISRVLINPLNPSIVFAGTNVGLFRSTNSGLTWTKVMNSTPIKDMEFKPGDPTVVYAVTSKSFYRSTNSGANFSIVPSASGTPATSSVGRLAIAVTPADPTYVYLVASDATDNGFLGFYKSTNYGLNFTLQANSPNLMGWDENGSDVGGQGWYTLSIAASPLDKFEVAVGGVNIWRSFDFGETWQIGAHWYGAGGVPYVHADIHDLIYKPGTSELYAGCDGGIVTTQDGGSTFNDLSNGLQIGQMYRLGCSATNSSITLQGWQDNGTNLQSGTNWSRPIGGDGMECFVDWSNPDYMYGEYQYGEIQRSDNGGFNFNGIKNNINEDGEWITPWLQDPVNPQTIYAGYKNVWKSTNRGDNWTAISNFNSNGLKHLVVAPSNTQYIYATDGSIVYKTTNGGTSWNTINPPSLGGAITYLTVSSTNPNIIWLTRSGYVNNSKVFKSIDGGANWINMAFNLPNIPVNCVVNQAGTNDGVYIGTDLGVFYIDNSLSSWMPFNNGFPNTVVDELEIHYGSSKLRAATYGRGLWETSIYNPASLLPFANFNADSLSGCPGISIQFSDSTKNNPIAWQWYFPGGTPSSSNLQNPIVTYNNPGTYNNVTLIVTNANGVDSITKLSYISISPQITPTVSLNNNDTLCGGQNLNMLSSFASTYSWYPTGQVSQSINSNSTTNYAVTVTDVFGCSTTSDTIRVYAFPAPSTPIITSNNDTLYSSSGYGNQWYMNGNAISGETDSMYVITNWGATYSVSVTDSISGCSSTSSNFVGVDEETTIGIRFSLFPNPTTTSCNLILYSDEQMDVMYELTDVTGKLLSKKVMPKFNRLEQTIDLSNYQTGIYFLNLKNSKGVVTKKIIKY
jgi:PKD repeat protein